MGSRRPLDLGGRYRPPPSTRSSSAEYIGLQDFHRPTTPSNSPKIPEHSTPPPTGKLRNAGHHVLSSFSSCRELPWALLLPLLLWLVFVAVTVVCWVFHSRVAGSPTEFGLRTRWTAECGKLSNPFKSWREVALLTVNAVAGIVTAIVSYFRPRLLAPTPDGDHIDSWGGFWHVKVHRKFLYIILLLSPLPVYFLSNTLFFVMYLAFNSYEIVIFAFFFDGAPFNLSAVKMTRYDLNEAPTMPPSNLSWPSAYGGFERLNDSLAHLQREPGLWKNLSRADCVTEFNEARYTRYRTLLLVTDFGQPHGLPANNNSVLAAGVLPGYRLASAASSLVALCPDIYLAAYPRATVPAAVPFMPRDTSYGEPLHFAYVDPADAEAWATRNSSAPAVPGVDASQSLGRRQLVGAVANTVSWDTMPARDLCYLYWTSDEQTEEDGKGGTLYLVPRVDLKYCIAEPVTTARFCEAVYSPKVLFILAITLAVMLGAISTALLLQLRRGGDYSSEELLTLDSDYTSDHWYSQRRTPWQLEILNFVIFIYIWTLWSAAKHPDPNKLFPSNPRDDGWLIRARAQYNAAHVLFEVLFFFQSNNLDKRALSSSSFPSLQIPKLTALPLRAFLVHFVFGLVFLTQLQVVLPLDTTTPDNTTLAGGMLVSFATFGIPIFNERTEATWYTFLTFHWAIFVFLPTLWMEAHVFFATGSAGEVGWSLSTLAGCVTLPILAIVEGAAFARGNGRPG